VSRRDIPTWVIGGLGLWGRQKRRVWIGTDWHGNVDGYSQSLLGRIRDEREGAGEQGARSQFWTEVFWGMGLDVQRGIRGMREIPYSVLHLHYVWPPEWLITVELKAGMLHITKAEYWRELENAETWTHARLDSTSDCKPREKALHVVSQSATTSTQSASVAKVSARTINLAALNRPKLTLSR
jgi:hypothetical protein